MNPYRMSNEWKKHISLGESKRNVHKIPFSARINAPKAEREEKKVKLTDIPMACVPN